MSTNEEKLESVKKASMDLANVAALLIVTYGEATVAAAVTMLAGTLVGAAPPDARVRLSEIFVTVVNQTAKDAPAMREKLMSDLKAKLGEMGKEAP